MFSRFQKGFKSRELTQEKEGNCHAKVYLGPNLLHWYCISADQQQMESRQDIPIGYVPEYYREKEYVSHVFLFREEQDIRKSLNPC